MTLFIYAGFYFGQAAATPSACNYILGAISPLSASVDGNVSWDGLYADQTAFYMNPSEPSATDPVQLKIRVLANDITAAQIVYFDSSTQRRAVVEMWRAGQDPTHRFEYWQGELPASSAKRWYKFRIADQNRAVWYNACGPGEDESDENAFWIIPGFRIPSWAVTTTWYQIFPERFRNGDSSNDPPWTQPWGGVPSGDGFFGGDLEGVRTGLGYLRELGTNGIYLNPVFSSPSNHKYDTTNFKQVDPAFGSNALLARLVEEAHEDRGTGPIRIVLDGAFNHVNPQHPWLDIGGQSSVLGAFAGGRRQPQSPFYDRFTFIDSGCGYVTFYGFCHMAKLDYASSALQNDLWRNSDSVVQFWLNPPYSVDGWRLDTAHMLGTGGRDGQDNGWILQQFRSAIKGVSSDKLLIGETEWLTDQTRWLSGDQLDGVMNYQGFTEPLSRFINHRDMFNHASGLSVRQFDNWLRGEIAKTPFVTRLVAWNSLGTHDISRFLERADGDEWKLFEATFFQMTFVGAPVIYYGDEIGMRGGADPLNRAPFEWNRAKWNATAFQLHKDLILIRQTHSALQKGGLMTLLADDARDLYAFGRLENDQSGQVVVVLNNSAESLGQGIQIPVWYLSVPDGSEMIDLLTQQRYRVEKGSIKISELKGHWGLVLSHQ